ncbi:hypothetical protein PIIN_07881 [Serendipita indica DSM 11827]|uniref:Uncharacterized protein n=1 Tax=Serendipita indica (strain DSM 11827) TaxID=1109443 RepID=G4TRI5_SERID|nr:hypothetical protein PIIN_07881 [Serendipita indica DSM 11827]
MRNFLSLFSVLHFVVSVTAKGRGGGGGGGSIDDNWDAPVTIKVAMAFEIIYFIILLGAFITIWRRLHLVPPGRYTRAPYVLLTIALAYLLSAIYTRINDGGGSISTYYDGPDRGLHGLNAFNWFVVNIDTAFRPAVCLWLVHLRGNLARKVQNAPQPWVSQFWKRILDWSLVAITYLLETWSMGVTAHAYAQDDSGQMNSDRFWAYIDMNRGLRFTILTFILLLAIDIIVSFIALKVVQKRMNFIDPITTRLLVAVLPFVAIYFIQSLVVTVYPEGRSMTLEEFYGLELAGVILSGLCRVGIICGLLSTMTIPDAVWAPGQAIPNKEDISMSQQPQQPFYQPSWQIPHTMPAPGQYPQPGQYQPPQNPPPTH